MGHERGNDRTEDHDQVAAFLPAGGTRSLSVTLDSFLTLGDGSHLEFLDELLRILLHRVMETVGPSVSALTELVAAGGSITSEDVRVRLATSQEAFLPGLVIERDGLSFILFVSLSPGSSEGEPDEGGSL